MSILKRLVLTLSGAAMVLAVGQLSGPAVAFPDKPIIFVVPYGPGGPSDLGARVMQGPFKKVTDQELVIQNRPGAGGATAWSQLNTLKGDGYTVMLTAMPHIILQPVVNHPAGYQTEDITIVLVYGYLPEVLVVPVKSRHKSLTDLIANAKQRPGATTIAGTGIGGANHAAQVLFDRLAGIKTTYVPFKDTASANTAVMGAQVEAAWTWLSQGQTLSDRLRMLAVAAEERVPTASSLPTLRELGYNMTSGAWWAIAVPSSMSEEMKKQVSATFQRVIADKQYQAKMTDLGYVTLSIGYPEVKQFVAQKINEFRPVAAQLKKK